MIADTKNECSNFNITFEMQISIKGAWTISKKQLKDK